MARMTVGLLRCGSMKRTARALILAGTMTPVAGFPAASLSEPQWVSFESARVQPSALSTRLSDASSANQAEPLRGMLVGPLGAGPFPAVVLVHGCRGLLPGYRGWAHWLASHGFVALLVDSFFTRHASDVCSLGPDAAARQELNGRVFDAFGALQYLSRHPLVDPARVAIMGWDSWAPLNAVARSGPRGLFASGFRAAIAVTPDCPLDADTPQAPALVLAAGAAADGHARRCRHLAERLAGALSVSVLSGAARGFDDGQAGDGALVPAAFDLRTASALKQWVRYDARAHQRAAREVIAFLAPVLQPTVRSTSSRRDRKAAGAQPHWVVAPGMPGRAVARGGRSLFERVFAGADGEVRVPFPFAKVLERLAREVGAEPGGRDGVAVSLIPLGRSLQRDAAAPDFFRFPRVVVAVDGEPRDAPRARLLKDRLFLGYQEKNGVIEVISYNETVGRFEFQVVNDYLPHGKPTLRQANRALCMSCHQNAAPIFSRAAWDESNNNLNVAGRLRAARVDFHGRPALTGDASAFRVDNATDRANMLATWQLLWREGCGGDGARAPACRAAVLLAMIQERLSGSSGHHRDSPTYRVDFLDTVHREWRRRWPGGLAIPDGDLPNREPLLDPEPTHIHAREDPLSYRPPIAIWRGEADATRLVAGLAASLAQADLAALDRFLLRQGAEAGAPRSLQQLDCSVQRRGHAESRKRLYISCRGAGGAGRLEMELPVRNAAVLDGHARYLELPDGERLERLRAEVSSATLARSGGSLRLRLMQNPSSWSVRDVSGRALESVALEWTDHGSADGTERTLHARATLTMLDDFQPVRAAVDAMVASRDEALGDEPFRPTAVMTALLERLGAPHRVWCCEVSVAPTALPLHDSDLLAFERRPEGLGPEDAGALQIARRRCGACHSGKTRVPPGFLYGGAARAVTAMGRCAPRIARRLSLWHAPEMDRAQSPMPPPALLASQGLSEDQWRASSDFLALSSWAREKSRSVEDGRAALCLPLDVSASQ